MISLQLVDAEVARVEPIWRALEARARPTYFLGWGWIGTWLACLPRGQRPQLAVLVEGDAPIAACLLGRQRSRRHHLWPVRARHLNVSGDARLDELTLEHNGLLCAGAAPLAQLVARLPRDWDELALPGLDRDALPKAVAGVDIAIDREVTAPYVDLARVRSAGYLSLISAETRAQIRRARRGAGELGFEVARDLPGAFAIYDELVALHGASWRARGELGAFADPWFDRFHRALIAARFAHGEIELARITAGGRTLGCLYNLVAHGHVAAYQSGFEANADPRIKPGFLAHAAAIEHAAVLGHARYDFLGGDARYKKSLATDATQLVWARLVRPRFRFAIERWLRAATA